MSENAAAADVSAVAEEEEDDDVVTLEEAIQVQQELRAESNALLGASDPKNCTYSQGYLNRQALYSCLTCIPEARHDVARAAGVCVACCYNCHEGHELIELYTKRKFRCDCGNSKFENFHCKLDDKKAEVNVLNAYNQNFTGVYCTCKRPYPDDQDTVSDIMIQCIVCEDWYHSRHLGVEIPPPTSYAEMICGGCVSQHEFLLHYEGLTVNKITQGETSELTDVLDEDQEMNKQFENSPDKSFAEAAEFENPLDKSLAAITECKMPKIKSKITTKFFPDVAWRQQLCTCVSCLKLYEEEKVLFLIDPQDTLHIYEEKGTAQAEEDERKQEEQLLNSLDRVPLMETIAAYHELKEELADFFKKFAENKKVVREEDVKEFFDGLKARKRRKVEMPYFCR